MKQILPLFIALLLLSCGDTKAPATEAETEANQELSPEKQAQAELEHEDELYDTGTQMDGTSEADETVGMPEENEVVPIPDFSNYISEHEEVMDQQVGLLDADNHSDWLVAVRTLAEDSVDTLEEPMPRRLLIMINNGDNTYTLKSESQGAILCKDCGGMFGDPFDALVIKNRYFSVEHYGGSSWRWRRIITFKYNAEEQDWFLHKDGNIAYHSSDPENTYEEEVRGTDELGVVRFSQYNYEDF